MKHLKLFFALFAMLALGVGNAWAEETLVYTLDGTQTGGSQDYATESDITQGDISWKVTGNTTMNPWRIGGKKITAVDRTVYNTTAIPGNISKITIEHGTAASITVNSFTLIVASDASFSSVVSTLTGTFAASSTIAFVRPDGHDWTNRYYKLIYNLTYTSNSNKFVQFMNAKFYAEESTSEPDPDPTPDPEPEPDPTPDPGTGTTSEVTFIFDTDQGLSELGIAKPNAGAGTNLGNNVYTKAPINMTATDGSTATRVWNSSGATTLRVYKSTGSLTFSSEATINKIVFNTSITATASVGTLSGTTWTGEAKEVKFTFTVNATIKTITVAYTVPSSGGGSTEPVVLLIPKTGYFEGLLLVQLLALFLQQKDSFSATLQVPPCTRW